MVMILNSVEYIKFIKFSKSYPWYLLTISRCLLFWFAPHSKMMLRPTWVSINNGSWSLVTLVFVVRSQCTLLSVLISGEKALFHKGAVVDVLLHEMMTPLNNKPTLPLTFMLNTKASFVNEWPGQPAVPGIYSVRIVYTHMKRKALGI